MPESVKVLTLAGRTENTQVGSTRIDWALGRNEIAIMLGIRVVFQNDIGLDNDLNWAIFRKSEAEPPPTLILYAQQALSDFVAGGRIATDISGPGLNALNCSDDFLFPYPLVLIRPSQFLTESKSSLVEWVAYLYYLTQEVTDEQLAKLMVKDHA